MASGEVHPASEPSRWRYLDNVRTRAGPFTNDEVFDAGLVVDTMDNMKILVIGAGGLGCEILKNLALSGFKDIHVIDMDTIDISNLNRQFLFRKADVGKFKAEVAASFVERRVKGVKITPHNCKIQDFDEDFYMQFQLVVCGLDSIEARRWINATLVNMVDPEVEDSYKPLIDGGTEGFKGQSRVVLPSVTSCIECQLDMHAPRAAVPLCTIATIPRQPEHCIEWAHIIAWDQEKPFPKLDNDDPEHITWLYQKALNRAEEYGITGVTYSRTQGVVKNIIPAIASTNAIIAASCCNEALKIASNCAPSLGYPNDNYMMYSGNDSIYTYTFEHEKKDDCPVCGNLARDLEVDPRSTLQELIESMAIRPEAQLKKPSVRSESKTLYMQSPPSLEEKTRQNLDKTLTELGLGDGEEIGVTDPSFATVSFKFRLRFK
ncbi:NEDD8-activating enzyme E1 catalytic subunit [Phialemonium atrogriseum]|uniref:NEDD8-activating enzyme E1 catalytic subunit n=1 Tax=Phialemonium atrogriseum TaxID=1093897 RepID=A0AAJ0C3I5_9PEZI|nr:NEDD8-activating enzyme E1 catalytic subunit [Phialemonium atrogriseum]KAK1768423.1 NEDD8-activating enzyme E1 catalytic subunit [Phialemonium atrogriseum]